MFSVFHVCHAEVRRESWLAKWLIRYIHMKYRLNRTKDASGLMVNFMQNLKQKAVQLPSVFMIELCNP